MLNVFVGRNYLLNAAWRKDRIFSPGRLEARGKKSSQGLDQFCGEKQTKLMYSRYCFYTANIDRQREILAGRHALS